MKNIQYMAFILIAFNINFLYGNSFINFNSIEWDWVAVIILSLLFFILLISIIIDIKKSRKKIDTFLTQEKLKNSNKNKYLNHINQERFNATVKLNQTIQKLNSTINDKVILDKLIEHQKEIFLSNQEENIFLHIALNKEIGYVTNFNLNDMIEELKKLNILKNSYIDLRRDSIYPIVSNKEIIQSIIFLMTRLQLKEHNLITAKIGLRINEDKKVLTISTLNSLELNKYIKKILENKLEPIYCEDEKYYGVYLYLISKLTSKLNGDLNIITTNEQEYSIEISIPVEFEKASMLSNVTIPKKLKESKKALVISKKSKIANKIAAILKEYNFIVDIELNRQLNKELPNFLDYDTIFMDAELFEPILSDYIISIKKYKLIKIVSLENPNRIYEYPKHLLDDKLDISNIENNLILTIEKLYSKELVKLDKKETKVEDLEIEKRRSCSVLIADDDITNLHILEYLLKQYNINVTTATNGIEVLKQLHKKSFDLIILDSIMPKMDGFETVQEIRKKEKFSSTPIIIHTSFSLEKKSMEEIFQLGFDSYLPKPFNKYELKSLLERYLPIYIQLDEKQESENTNLDNHKLEEFIAIYGNSDKIIEKYLKEGRKQQLISIINNLETIAKSLNNQEFLKISNSLKNNLDSNDINSDLLYQFKNSFNSLKSEIMQKISR